MDLTNGLQNTVAMSSIVYIFIAVLCIGVSWWVLQAVRIDLFLRNPKGVQARLLQVLLSVALGYQMARFLIDYLNWSLMLKWMF